MALVHSLRVSRSHDRSRHAASRAWSAREWALVRALFTAVVAAVYYVAATVWSSWFADDFLFLQLARDGELTPSWLAGDNYGHFAPFTRFAYLFVQRVGGLDYQFAAIVPVALSTAAAFALLSLLGEISGRRPRTVVLAAAGGLSVFIMRVVLWWGAGVHVLGALAAELFCMWCFVVFLRTGHRRWLAASWIALVMGLLVQERPVLIIGFLLLLRYVGLRRGPALRGLGQELRADLPMWAGYVAITVVYLGYRLFVFPSSPNPGGVGPLADIAVYGTLNNLLPGTLGARVATPGDPGAPPVFSGIVLLSILAAVLAVACITWARRESWRPWVFYLPCLLANLVIVAVGRTGVWNALAIAYDQQYFVEAHVLLMVTLAIALSLPPRPAWLRAAPSARRIVRLVVAVTAAFVLVSTFVTWKTQVDDSSALPSKPYIERAVAGLEAFTSEEPVDLLEFTMPTEVNPYAQPAYNDQPGMMRVDGGLRARLDPGAATKVVITPSGRVVRVAPVELARLTPEQLAQAQLVGGAEVAVADGRACVTAPRGAAIIVGLPEPVESSGLFLSLEYDAPAAASVLPGVADTGENHYNWFPVQLPAGRDARVTRLRHDRADGLALVFPDGADDLCLDGLAVLEVALLDPVPVADAPSGVRCPVLDGSGQVTDQLARCDGRWR
jgi:hypothetical protein